MSRTPLLVGAVGVLIVASLVALVLTLTGSDDSSPAAGRTDRANQPFSSSLTPTPSGSLATPSGSPAGRGSSSTVRPTISSTPVARASALPRRDKTVTYVVKRGDNLTVIAAWFKMHGYGDLYQRNKKVIGRDPNLILPGQRITISSASGTMTVDR